MADKIISLSGKAIELLFYALFFLVPLFFTGNTSELFEFNKMWLTFGIASLILFFWGIRMIASGEFLVKRTPLDIPIMLFLLAHILSTVFSLDRHISFWGYYSRFNGGLLSIIVYVFLYYAFASNFDNYKAIVKKVLLVTLIGGAVVALWGLPSHFGYDPTCLVFRRTLDVSCWTVDFQPKVRIFSTLGQPAWLAAYLAALIPVSLGFAIHFKKEKLIKSYLSLLFIGLSSLFYLDFLFTRTRAGVLGLALGLAFFFIVLFLSDRRGGIKKLAQKHSILLISILSFALISFLAGIPLSPLDKASLPSILERTSTKNEAKAPPPVLPHSGQLGGTDSGKIRLLVWKGALNIWRESPILGTGVETFAYAYYKARPVEHNLTSEWNFLYNKAHNEYLNYLATPGAVGLFSYLFFITLFLLSYLYALLGKSGKRIERTLEKFGFAFSKETFTESKNPLVLGLVGGFLTILITNFFGFSVVIMNIFLILFPLFTLLIMGFSSSRTLGLRTNPDKNLNLFQWMGVIFLGALSLYFILFLVRSWRADVVYALGSNYQRANAFDTAYPLLHRAVEMRAEPVFLDEMAVNDANLSVGVAFQGASESAQIAEQLAQEAITINDRLVKEHPNNIIYWKSRVRIFYNLSQLNPAYLKEALEAMKKAHALGPNEASLNYNLGVLYGQNGDTKKAIEVLEKTAEMKPDYRDAHYALALFYNESAVNENGDVVDEALRKKAIDEMQFILINISPDDKPVMESLKSWGVPLVNE